MNTDKGKQNEQEPLGNDQPGAPAQKGKSSKPKRPKKEGQKTLAQLSEAEKSKALDEFAAGFAAMLEPNSNTQTRELVLKRVGDEMHCTFDVRQFDNFLVALGKEGMLKVYPRIDSNLQNKIKEKHKINNVTVVAGSAPSSFEEVSARVFMEKLNQIGRKKGGDHAKHLCVGIVSGSTIKATIEQICHDSDDWLKRFGATPKDWPQLKIFALNTSPATPKDIGGNANILCYRLAQKAMQQGAVNAEAYGLNAEVIVEKSRLQKIDNMPQTRDVLEITEPHRLYPDKRPGESDLDVILTGAGALDPEYEKNSIFYRLAVQENLDIAALIEGGLIGDLAYTGLNLQSNKVPLIKKTQAGSKGADGEEIVFYSAASLEVFKEIATKGGNNKAVILVARSDDQTDKAGIVLASRKYVTDIVICERTAGNMAFRQRLTT